MPAFDQPMEALEGAATVPPGTYRVRIVETEITPSKAGDDMLVVIAQVVDGPCAGMRVRERLNLWHSTSAKAREIAVETARRITHAVGLQTAGRSEEWHGRECQVKIEEDGSYTRIARWEKLPAGSATATSDIVVSQQVAPELQAPPEHVQPPWAS